MRVQTQNTIVKCDCRHLTVEYKTAKYSELFILTAFAPVPRTISLSSVLLLEPMTIARPSSKVKCWLEVGEKGKTSKNR